MIVPDHVGFGSSAHTRKKQAPGLRRPCAIAMIALSLAARRAQAQGLVESADGLTSILLKSGAQVSVNFSDNSVRFGLLRRVSTKWLLYGAEIKLRATDGVANVTNAGFHPPETHMTFTVGWQGEPSAGPLQYQRVSLQASLNYLKMNLADTVGRLALRTPSSTTTSVTANYNVFSALGGQASAVVGVSVSFGGRNNYDDLDKMQLCTQVAVQGAERLLDCNDARLGPVAATDAFTETVDVALFPGWKDAPESTHRTTSTASPRALGLLFSKPGSPLAVVGGITLEFGGVTRLGVQVGLPF